MQCLSEADEQTVRGIGHRHGFGAEAALSMMDAVARGGGAMAQFSHAEFGGSGQWMRGGMIMVSDMFNADLKNRVHALCRDLAALVDCAPEGRGTSSQSQRQGISPASASGESSHFENEGAASHETMPTPVSARAADRWWPEELGLPDSTGAQNAAKYAYFARAKRLAIAVGGEVTVYDTLDHRIDGFSQQQPGTAHAAFHSQHGDVDVSSLPVVSRHGARSGASPTSTSTRSAATANAGQDTQGRDPLTDLDRLAALNAKGVISDDEFAAKKQELLRRL